MTNDKVSAFDAERKDRRMASDINERKLAWALKAFESIPTRKRLNELAERIASGEEIRASVKDDFGASVAKSFERAGKTGCFVVTFADKEYPDCFRKIALPPPVLYVRGNVGALSHEVYVGMVGCRKSDDYGIRTAANIAAELAQLGIGIVSGGAVGIDAASHSGAIRGGAPTVAFLGCGLDVAYPHENIPLFKKIVDSGGAVVSEFPFGEPPERRNFPHRNRLIAALSKTVAVIRAGNRSGALITANYAEKMGKTIFAVPGNIDNYLSAGTNALIRDGVLPLLSSMDIVDELMLKCPDFFAKERGGIQAEDNIPGEKIKPMKKKKAAVSGLSEAESEIVQLVESGICTDSELAEKISFDPARLTALLGILELKGVLTRGFNKKYSVTPGGND